MIIGAQDVLRWHPHVEVWALVVGLVGLYGYALGVIGPKAVPSGRPAGSRSQRTWFTVGVVTLVVAADWPVHDLAERSLYSVHMVQHLLLTMVMAPAFLLATPEWLARRVLGRPCALRWLERLAHPVVALGAFSGLVLVSHWPAFVNRSVGEETFHFLAHLGFVATVLLFWLPVCGPLRELRLGRGAQMIYLFVASIVPTVPASWLIFANDPVYAAYDHGPRLWGISVITDQQLAGVVMKLVGAGYLWVLITITFFRWAAEDEHTDTAPRRSVTTPARRTLSELGRR